MHELIGSDYASTDGERQLRIELAAAFRLAAQFDWHEAVGNHFSVAIVEDGRKFLMNPRWRHFATLRASDLLLLDSRDRETMNRSDAPEISGWCIHGAIHAQVPQARCVMHLHPPYATALAGLADPTLKPIDQNTARYYRRLTIDRNFGGLANDEDEGRRLAQLLGSGNVVLLGNHGVLVTGPTVAEAFGELYYLERACRTMVLAYQTGQPLSIMPDELAEKTAVGWQQYDTVGLFNALFSESVHLLDLIDRSYAD